MRTFQVHSPSSFQIYSTVFITELQCCDQTQGTDVGCRHVLVAGNHLQGLRQHLHEAALQTHAKWWGWGLVGMGTEDHLFELVPVFFFFSFGWVACRILIPRPGIDPAPPVVEAWSLNQWTAREVSGACLMVDWRVETGFWKFAALITPQ